MSLVVSFLACTPPGTSRPPPPAPAPASEPAPTPTSATGDTTPPPTGDTGATVTTPPPLDCTQPPVPVPVAVSYVDAFGSSEDFDLDADGFLGLVQDAVLSRKDMDGNWRGNVASSVSWSTAGTRVLSTGDWVVADVFHGSLVRIDAATGAKVTLSSSFSWPNGIEVGEGDQLFVSDFSTGRVLRVNAYDPEDTEQIAEGLVEPNGLVLSPDELTLYVVETWAAAVVAFDKDPASGAWTGPRLVHSEPDGSFQGLNTDACGNLYVTDAERHGESRVLRIVPDGSLVEVLAVLTTEYPPNLRFGSGIGGWERDVLYVLSRDRGSVYALEAGIVGKPPVWE